MDTAGSDAERFFKQPVRQLTTMLIVVALVAVGGWFAWPRVSGVFLSNPYLNGLIFLVFLVGVLSCFWQVARLFSSVRWISDFAKHLPGHQFVRAPRLLAALAQLLRSRGARSQISATSASSILDSVATRIDEARDITRYLVNLLVFLGLLGTFWGLANTVPAVVQTIQSLAPKEGQSAVEVFGNLMGGLQKQLGGMGTAFSSSLLGLAGSLVVGLLELFASQAENRFYRQLEDWLSTITRLGLADGGGDGEHGVLAAVIDQMAEQMENLQALVAQSEASRAETTQRLGDVAVAVERLTQGMAEDRATRHDNGVERALMERLVTGQERVVEILSDDEGGGGAGGDAESRMRLRSIDVQLLRILEELSAGRQESLSELRGDIAQLTKAIRALGRIDGRTDGGRG
ncbi:biopolymer transporter ExbB [Acidimangrovimonas sediminis]|uniref:biopolymer transporter ExbB n=1 Tax=Acidimangrovimonas sediminis TaxID=2056283 RepID=UPI000C7FD408|nr:biopolymer transporter ExbB [Acidimangrovimonas sediminis]